MACRSGTPARPAASAVSGRGGGAGAGTGGAQPAVGGLGQGRRPALWPRPGSRCRRHPARRRPQGHPAHRADRSGDARSSGGHHVIGGGGAGPAAHRRRARPAPRSVPGNHRGRAATPRQGGGRHRSRRTDRGRAHFGGSRLAQPLPLPPVQRGVRTGLRSGLPETVGKQPAILCQPHRADRHPDRRTASAKPAPQIRCNIPGQRRQTVRHPRLYAERRQRRCRLRAAQRNEAAAVRRPGSSRRPRDRPGGERRFPLCLSRQAMADLVAVSDGRSGVGVAMEERGRLEPVAMDDGLRGLIADAAAALGAPAMPLPSGAIHDAVVLAPCVPTAMMFVPSIGGRSHTPVEDTAPEHIVLGARVFARAVFAGAVAACALAS
nr:M20/M25/M40 family metallo-hydrolase [Azospirillum thiophilum]